MSTVAMRITKNKQVYAGTFIEQSSTNKPAVKKDSSVYFTEIIEDTSKNVSISKTGTLYASEFIESTTL